MRLTRAAMIVAAVFFVGARAPERPPITGISHLAVYSRDLVASERFYAGVLGARKVADPENGAGARFQFSGTQFVEVLPAPAGLGASLFAHAAYRTPDAAALRSFSSSRCSSARASSRRPRGSAPSALAAGWAGSSSPSSVGPACSR